MSQGCSISFLSNQPTTTQFDRGNIQGSSKFLHWRHLCQTGPKCVPQQTNIDSVSHSHWQPLATRPLSYIATACDGLWPDLAQLIVDWCSCPWPACVCDNDDRYRIYQRHCIFIVGNSPDRLRAQYITVYNLARSPHAPPNRVSSTRHAIVIVKDVAMRVNSL